MEPEEPNLRPKKLYSMGDLFKNHGLAQIYGKGPVSGLGGAICVARIRIGVRMPVSIPSVE